MKSLIIFFPSIFLAKKIDDFEGCLKGVAMCLNADSTLLAGVPPSPCFPIFLARTTFVLESLLEAKNPGQDAFLGGFCL